MHDRISKTNADYFQEDDADIVALPMDGLVSSLRRVLHLPRFSPEHLSAGVLQVFVTVGLLLMPLQSLYSQVDRRKFDESMREWKAVYVEVAECYAEIRTCEEEDFETLKAKLISLKLRGDQHLDDAISEASVIYKASDQNIEEIKAFLATLPVKLFDQHKYALAADVNDALLNHDPQNVEYLFDGIKAAFFSNKYDLCADLLGKWKSRLGSLPPQLEPIAAYLDDYRTAWHAQEKELADSASGIPRPRLELGTEDGTIVVELDEDRYPILVNNLVNHVSDRALYRNFQFFEVLEHQVARSGCPANNGSTVMKLATLNPETMKSPLRHFRGTFTIMVNGNNGEATTQFYICRIPMPEFDGRFLPIGRVVSGMEVVDELTATYELDEKLAIVRIEGATPVTISSAKITHKRDHPYIERDEIQ